MTISQMSLKTTFAVWLTLALMVVTGACSGQSFTNPGFESGTTGWTCAMEVNSASVYGGSGSNMVAEVDGHINASSTADDRLLCQTVTGFTVGSVYALEFDATRRQATQTPATVSVRVTLGGALDVTVTRTGAWNMVRERLNFTATATSLALQIRPNFTTSFGMLFDNFSISVVSPLPVTLVRFEAWPKRDAVEVEWATATERNNAVFVVERSADLEAWDPISEVEGAGNSQTMITYGTEDQQPLRGTSYYRLKQIDHDGTEVLSQVRPVQIVQKGRDLFVWPNPAKELLHVQMDGPNSSAQVFNALGQPMHVAQAWLGNVVAFHIAALPSGTYQVRTRDPKMGTTRFIKE